MADKKYTILLAEDDAFLQRMYATKLDGDGFNVISASDGQEALDKASSTEIDAVLLDILMPKKSGFEVLKEMRANSKFKDLPIIILTNLNDTDDIKKAKALGASEYVVKSHFLPSEVVELVQKHLK